MTEITIFTAPKPFSDPHINTIQRNAIRSWKELGNQVQVLLIGDEEGIKDAAEDLGVTQVPDVAKNDLGTPLVNSIFEIARNFSEARFLLYVNADIILLPDLLVILDKIDRLQDDFLLVGRRWNLDHEQDLDFSETWQEDLVEKVKNEGKLSSATAMDYFIFSRELFQDIPPFAIGRAGWDNWMIFHALQQGWPVIDITASNIVVHQNHDYRHLPDGKVHYDQEESFENVRLGGGIRNTYDLIDVDLFFQNGRIRKKPVNLTRMLRNLERIVIPSRQEGIRWQMTRILRKARRRIEKNRRRNG